MPGRIQIDTRAAAVGQSRFACAHTVEARDRSGTGVGTRAAVIGARPEVDAATFTAVGEGGIITHAGATDTHARADVAAFAAVGSVRRHVDADAVANDLTGRTGAGSVDAALPLDTTIVASATVP